MKNWLFILLPIILFLLNFSPIEAQQRNGHSYVDLGLPSGNLWSTSNMGASYPTDYGDYYAWGELTTKYYYNWDSYKFYSQANGITKYNQQDGLDILEPEDDVAHVKWGGNWQIPSWEDWAELLEYVDVYTVSENGIKYYSLVSKNNSGKLILPLNGLKTDNNDIKSRGLAFCIWLCSTTALQEWFLGLPMAAKEGCAYAFLSEQNQEHTFNDLPIEVSRCNGLAIRPVYCKQGKLSKAQRDAKAQREDEERQSIEREERLRIEREIRENEVYPVAMTSFKPLFLEHKEFVDSAKAFRDYLKDKIGRDLEYSITVQVVIGRDGRVYDASVLRKNSGPGNIEALFKKAALSSPTWVPAKEPKFGEYTVNCAMIISLTNP